MYTSDNTTQHNPLDYTLDEWLELRGGWLDPRGDAEYWRKSRESRLNSAAADSFREIGIDPLSFEKL